MRDKNDWIHIGEVEEPVTKKTCFETTDSEWHLFKFKEKHDGWWVWSIAPSAERAFMYDTFMMDIDVSPLTFLVYFISQDRIYGRTDAGRLIKTCQDMKIRFVGMTEWLEVDDDFLNKRIDLLELENKFRKHKLTREMLGNN